MFFSMLVTPNTLPCFSTHFREQGPCFDSKEVFRGRETGRIPSCGNRSWQLKGVRMPQTGSPWHCCHGRHGYYDFILKNGMPLIFAQLRWNDVQTTVNIWKLIAFDPKGPWKSFRKSHCYRGFVWNPARFDGMHDLVQMVNENYIEKP